MHSQNTHYKISAALLQSVVGLLNVMPAGQSRAALNQLEQECLEQDKERAEAHKQAELDAAIANKGAGHA